MRLLTLTLVSALLLLSVNAQADPTATPVGLWKSINEQGKITGYIRISETDGVFRGLAERSAPGDKPDRRCDLCRDERRGCSSIRGPRTVAVLGVANRQNPQTYRLIS